MKSIKIFGLAFFIIAFTLFNISLFFSEYVLTDAIVESHISDEGKRNVFLKHADDLLNQRTATNFSFCSSLEKIFQEANEEQLKKFSFSKEELRKLIGSKDNSYYMLPVDSTFRVTNESATFRNKVFKDYSAWLTEKKFSSEKELEASLNKVSDELENYAIVQQFGFDRYARKDLTYSLTKASSIGAVKKNPFTFFMMCFLGSIIGAMLYILPQVNVEPGVKNNGVFFNPMKNVGWLGILTGTWLILFYIALYFFPEYITNWIIMVDPVSQFINGHEASRFFLYGLIYTLAILVMGVRFIIRYRHNKYHTVRTLSVMFFQTSFAFLIPEILVRLNKPYYDFKNIWPLDYTFFFDFRINQMISNGSLGIFMLVWGIILIIIAVPVLVYFFGKRWYCSWVCGCGGLAETLGDPYRHLSDKSLKAWRIERWMVHGVLAFAVVMTGAVLYTYFTGSSWFVFIDSYSLREIYGSLIGAGFAGVVGTGFYPLMGNRVWCRFGCPLAAYLGIVQRFKSRFRITTNGGQCISCGNCSTYCEMGIDVRWYAQRGQNIVRASCVGCGICSSVCPRGVLNLEVKQEDGRFGKPILIGNNNAKLVD